jgi:hypothetical protein
MITTTQPNVERARATVAEEVDIVAAERNAFQRLLARLSRLETTDGAVARTAGGAAGGSLLVRSTPAQDGTEAVRTAYRETVMAVPHYDREYGDSLPASLRTEFGDRLAEQVVDDGPLTPMLQQALLGAVREAVSDRSRFLDVLGTERRSLEESERELDAVESRTAELAEASTDSADRVDELDRLESRCATVSRRRQELIHDRSSRDMSGVGGGSLLAYLYDGTDTRFPVLADASSCLRTIEAVRRDVVE